MNSSIKNFLVAWILAAVLAISVLQIPKVQSAELTAPEKTMMFLKDVVKVDVTKYNATLVSNWVDYPPHWGGLAQEDVTYNLDCADESKLYVTCKFREGRLHYCGLEVLKGSPIYAEPQATNVLDSTKGLLERYQTYSRAPYIQTMRGMLDTVDVTKNMTITAGNVELTTSSQEVQNDPTMEAIERTSFEWIYTVNGVDTPQNMIRFTFDNGVFSSFRDDWDLFKIGSTEVKVSREEAINLARNAAEDYTLQIYLEDGLTDVEFNLADEPVTAELLMYPRETLTVYPFWRIELYFDKLYYSAYGIGVGIWADTKQIKYCESLSFVGGPIVEEDPTASATEQNGTASSMNIYIITTTVACVVTIVAATIALKKKRK
jgi:hypothetical protein